ncbi:hypothetical protein ACKWTF_014557 [Chironomus riparius]
MPDNLSTFIALAISFGLVLLCLVLYIIAKKCVNRLLDEQNADSTNTTQNDSNYRRGEYPQTTVAFSDESGVNSQQIGTTGLQNQRRQDNRPTSLPEYHEVADTNLPTYHEATSVENLNTYQGENGRH